LYLMAPDIAGVEPRRASLYMFSLNNPVRYLDPDGLDDWDASTGKHKSEDLESREERDRSARANANNYTDGGHFIGGEQKLELTAKEQLYLFAVVSGYGVVAGAVWAGAIFAEKGPAGGSEAAMVVVFHSPKAPVIGSGSLADDASRAGSISSTADDAARAGGDGLAKAQSALGDELSTLAKRSKKKLPAASVGAFNPKTGVAAADSSFKGCCAEVGAAAKVGGSPKDVIFTWAVRPRKGKIVPVCKNCQGKFDRTQFPPGTQFD